MATNFTVVLFQRQHFSPVPLTMSNPVCHSRERQGAFRSASWDALQPKWRAALCDFGVPCLHMREFAHSTNAYAGWKNDEPKRREFLERFTSLTLEASWSIYGASVDLDAIRTIETERKIDQLVDLYFICLQRIICDSALEAMLYPNGEAVQVVAATSSRVHAEGWIALRYLLGNAPVRTSSQALTGARHCVTVKHYSTSSMRSCCV